MTWWVVKTKGWHAHTPLATSVSRISHICSFPSTPLYLHLHPVWEMFQSSQSHWSLREMNWEEKQQSKWCVTKEGLFDRWSRECTEWNEEKSGANIKGGSLGHCAHICLVELNMEEQSCREVIQRQRWEFLLPIFMPQHLFFLALWSLPGIFVLRSWLL